MKFQEIFVHNNKVFESEYCGFFDVSEGVFAGVVNAAWSAK